MIEGAIIGAVVAVIVVFAKTLADRRHAKRGTGLPGRVEQALRGKPALNQKAIAERVGLRTLAGRGKVVQALNALSAAGKVRTQKAPPGTPLHQIAELTTYEAI
ncbi:hypothetical protein BH11MYX1_BH11MYX1_21430 [soil metagenome]